MSAEDVLSEVNKMTGNDLARYIKSVGVSRDKFGELAGLRPSGMNFRIHYRGVDADKPIQNLIIEDKFDKDETLKKLSEAGIVKKVWAVEN